MFYLQYIRKMKKVVFMIWLFVLLAAIGYGIYVFVSNPLSPRLLKKNIGNTREIIDTTMQSGMQYMQSGVQKLESGAQNLLQSWQVLFDQKKQEAEQYLRDQRDQLKADAQQAVQDAAKEKIDSFFNK